MAPPGPANGRDPSPKPPPNLNKATGYTQRTADLSTFAGQTVTLTFTATEDASLQTSFVVDDTAVTLS